MEVLHFREEANKKSKENNTKQFSVVKSIKKERKKGLQNKY